MSIFYALAAILLWSTLAAIGARLVGVPPFLQVGIALLIGGALGLVRWRDWRVRPAVLAVGVMGIFGYHALYFSALALAPAVEASLLNYLWPLLIVLLSPLVLPGTRLRAHHILGAVLGLVGAGLILTGGQAAFDLIHLPGYLLAAAAGLTWALYSLMTRRLAPFSTGAVGLFCLLSGLLSMGLFFLSGGTGVQIRAVTPLQWLFLLALGLGPMGAAFFLWDAALKRGDPRVIGALSYLTPLLSTLNLVVFAGQRLTRLSLAAMLLILFGAVLGAFARKK